MVPRLLLSIVLLQREWRVGEGWCFYFCPKEKWPETFCAVDDNRGAKLFQGRCQIWRANYCLSADYRVMDMRQCVDRYPGVLTEYLLSGNSGKVLQRFDRSKGPPSVGPWSRFFLLWSLISRLSPRVYSSLPLLAWLLYPRPNPFDPFTYPGSPGFSPFSYPGNPRMNPFSYPGPPIFDPFNFPGSPIK